MRREVFGKMIKDLKLSDAMIKMITEAQYHEVRVNGEIVHRGYVIAGRVGTVVALMDRGLCTARTVEYHGVHWLTGLGLRTWAWITGNDLPASEDHPAESDMIDAQTSSVGARITAKIKASGLRMDGKVARKIPAFATAEIAAHEKSELHWADIESASDYDRRNADLERADIESEYRAEAEAEASEASWVPVEVINADDLMYRTRKGIWLSAGYFATMRLARADRLRVFLAFKAAQKIIQERYSGGRVTFLDEMLADGKVGFTAVDKARRTILAVCNPTLGSKVKPSSKKRNRR